MLESVSRLVRRVGRLLRRREYEGRMAEEMRFHLEMEAADLHRAGLSADAARRSALVAFGSTERFKEEGRDALGMRLLEDFVRDVRQGWRSIMRAPALALVVIVSLGVGIGVNTAVFSWIQAVVLNPIPGVAGSRDYYAIDPRVDDSPRPGGHGAAGSAGATRVGTSWPEYEDLRERLESFEQLIAFRMLPLTVGDNFGPVRVAAQLVSDNYFTALGLEPALGRFPSVEEASGASDAVVVISHGYWQTRFAGARTVVGNTLRVNGRDVTIVGVAPRDFQGTVLGLDHDLWLPAELAPLLLSGSTELDDRGNRGYTAAGRLREGIPLARAQAELDAAMTQLAAGYPDASRNVRADVLPYWRSLRGPQQFFIPALAILQGLMLLLLLAVCANTANLMLARASTRQHEVAVRRAIGASRSRILSLLLTESLVLAFLSAGLGIAIAVWGTNALRAGPIITAFPIRYQTSVDGVGLTVAAVLAVICALAFGLAPALQLLRTSGLAKLRVKASMGPRGALRGALMGIEVGLALVVLVAAAIFLQSFGETRDTDPGFQRDGVLLAAYDYSGRNLDDARLRAFAAELLERVRGLPAVESAAIARMVPLDIHGTPVRAFALEGRARSDAADDVSAINIVTSGYFATMGIPLLSGTDFTGLNDAAPEPQAIVNQAFVSQYIAGVEPIGRRIQAGGRSYTIIGVAATTLYNSFGESPTPIIYFSLRDRPAVGGELHVRTRPGAELALAPEIRRVARVIDPLLPIYDVRTLDQHIEKNLIFRRIPARMFVVLGPLLLILAAMGIYAVVAYNVARRAPEIALRLALGAPGRGVVASIVRDTLRVVAVGGGAGWLLAFMVYIHVAAGRPLDPAAFVGVPALLVLIATVAAWVPARRASRVDPMRTLTLE